MINIFNLYSFDLKNIMTLFFFGGILFSFSLLNFDVSAINEKYVFKSNWGEKKYKNGQLSEIHDVHSIGKFVYVPDYEDHKIKKFTSDGELVLEWGSEGSDQGEFDTPHSVATDSFGNVYITDMNNKRIQKFDENGTFILEWGGPGKGAGEFMHPHGIAIDLNNNIFVSDAQLENIQKFTDDGIFITKWGSENRNDEKLFGWTENIDVDSAGNVYVADMSESRVQKFDNNGTFIKQWGERGEENGEFESPTGLSVDEEDNVYVIDDTGRIQKFTDDGKFITSFGENGTENGQFRISEGLDVDSDGVVYIADTGNHRIQVFTKADQ